MAIAIISSENKTVNGNITIPAGCTLVIGLTKGQTSAPKINNVNMVEIISLPQNGIMPAVGIYQYVLPAIATLPFTLTGSYVEFVYLSSADSFRPGALIGQSTTGSFTGNIAASTTDLALGIVLGTIGPTALKGDTAAMTYLLNTATEKIGYLTPADVLLTCLAEDTGVSAGYYVDGGSIYHPAVELTAAYDSFDPVLHTITHAYDHHDTPWTTDTYRTYDNGNFIGYTDIEKGYVPATTTYIAYPLVHHDAVYSEAWTEYLPDTWVPGGAAASLSAAFCCIKTTAAPEDESDVIWFG